jgi:hypothetical protein
MIKSAVNHFVLIAKTGILFMIKSAVMKKTGSSPLEISPSPRLGHSHSDSRGTSLVAFNPSQ